MQIEAAAKPSIIESPSMISFSALSMSAEGRGVLPGKTPAFIASEALIQRP